jgi:uncharacterized membrane protein (UPF0127 family)
LAAPAKLIVVAALAVVIIAAVYEIYAASAGPGTVVTKTPAGFSVGGRTYLFNYTATTQSERAAGLMNTKVTNSTTMLFAFPSFGKWTFWMYDTNTSLDMIWLNATGTSATVVYVVAAAPPCYDPSACQYYTPTALANYVIEAKAGFSAANGIEVGTAVQLG